MKTTPGDTMSNIWHRAYSNWYDNRAACNKARANAWGWVADRLARFA